MRAQITHINELIKVADRMLENLDDKSAREVVAEGKRSLLEQKEVLDQMMGEANAAADCGH